MIDVKESREFNVRICNNLADTTGISIEGQRGNESVRVRLVALSHDEDGYFSCELSDIEAAVRSARRLINTKSAVKK